MIEVDPDLLTIIDKAVEVGVKKGVKEAMLEYDRQNKNKKQNNYDKRLKNTKLLLENYRRFVEHCENAVYELETENKEIANSEFITLFDNIYDIQEEKFVVESIMKSKARTLVITKHIEKCVEFYKYQAMTSENIELKRRTEVLQMLYLDKEKKKYEEIADRLHISTKTVNRDRIKLTKELAPLFFGVDGVGLE